MNKTKIIAIAIVSVVVAVFLIVMIPQWLDDRAAAQSFKYEATDRTTEYGLFVESGRPEVRSEPLAATYDSTVYAGTAAGAAGWGLEPDGVYSTYGRICDKDNDGLFLNVERYLVCNIDPWNGSFYGVYLEDLSEQELALLPDGVEKDPDGIVWISSKYIR